MLELDEQQRAAAESEDARVWICAGPGSGKTRILSARVAHLLLAQGVGAHQISALTYTRTMATDLRRRIGLALPELVPCTACSGAGKIEGLTCGACMGQKGIAPGRPSVGTLHGLAAGWVRQALRGKLAGGNAILALRWISGPDFGIAQPEDVDDFIEVAYQENRKKITKGALRAGLLVAGAALERFTPQTEARRQLAMRNLATFADLLVMLQRMVGAPRDPAGPPRLADLVDHLVLDEAQDLSPLHWSIFDTWAPRGLTVAGDDAQSIFGFMHEESRKSLPAVPLFQDRLAQVEYFRVGRNYRSAESIVTDCSRVRSAIASDGACTTLELQPVREDQPGAVIVEHCDLDCEGASTAAFHVQGLIEGGGHLAAAARTFRPEEIAVLARTWAELEEVAADLKALGIPYAIPERGRDRWRSVAGRAVVALARAADRGFLDEQDARTVVRALGHANPAAVVAEAMGRATDRRQGLVVALDEHAVARAGLPSGWWSDALKQETLALLARHIQSAVVIGGKPLGEAADAMASWEPETDLREEEEPAPATPGEWLCWLSSDETNCNVQMREGHVILTTVHGAKGLEWAAVILIGASEGSLPSEGRMDKTKEDLAEAGRVLYVAMTRARDVLRVICPTTLRSKPRNPSRWLVRAGLVNAPADAG